jgi:hypothetical protein
MFILAYPHLFARRNKKPFISPIRVNARHELSLERVPKVHGSSIGRLSQIIAFSRKTFPLKKSGGKVSGSGT